MACTDFDMIPVLWNSPHADVVLGRQMLLEVEAVDLHALSHQLAGGCTWCVKNHLSWT